MSKEQVIRDIREAEIVSRVREEEKALQTAQIKGIQGIRKGDGKGR